MKVAINTDAHSTYDFSYLKYGIAQAMRAGFGNEAILNTYSWPVLQQMLHR